jgi:hypothetical protein
VGRHSAPRVTLRQVAAGTAAAGGLAIAMAGVLPGAASADPLLGNCGQYGPGGTQNPAVDVCTDRGYRDGVQTDRGDRIHALVKVDPVLCLHVIVDPEGNRRLVGTQGCGHRHETPVTPVCPPCPPGTPAATTCPTPAPTPVPVAPETPAPASPVAESPGSSSSSSSTSVVEAPPPSTVSGGPVVAH